MKANDLTRAGQAIYGKIGWKGQLAEALGVHRSTITRYLRGAEIPRSVELAVERLAEGRG